MPCTTCTALISSRNYGLIMASAYLPASIFLAVFPDALVEELALAQAVFLLDAGEADGLVDGNLPADGLRVDGYFAPYGFGVFLQHFQAEVFHSGGAQVGQELERRLRLAYE